MQRPWAIAFSGLFISALLWVFIGPVNEEDTLVDQVSTGQSAIKRGSPISNQDNQAWKILKANDLKARPESDADWSEADEKIDFDNEDAKAEYGVDRLMFMAFHNRPEIFRKVLTEYLKKEEFKNGKWQEIKDKEGSGLLHWAAMGDCTSCVDLLLTNGFPVDQKNSRGETALVYAAASGDSVLAHKLLKAGADPDVNFNEAGYTLLMDASFEGQIEVAQSLIEAKAQVNRQDGEGKSPLHYAAKEGHKELIALLIKAGANPKLTDKNGRKPLDYALEYHDSSISKYFRN